MKKTEKWKWRRVERYDKIIEIIDESDADIEELRAMR